MNRLLPATGMNHSVRVAWFAISCLAYDLTHHRKARP